MIHPSGISSNAVALANPWAVVPALGNLDANIAAVNRLPMLSHEEEQTYARQFREDNDLGAAGKLVMSHLRLVVKARASISATACPMAT